MVVHERNDVESFRHSVTARLKTQRGTCSFSKALQCALHPDDFLCLLGLYVRFNSCFAAGVASLAGQLALRADLFRDPAEPLETLADRSVEVAAPIFFAGREEFGDPLSPNGATHRSLAQATLKATVLFWGQGSNILNDSVLVDDVLTAAMERIKAGYGIARTLHERDLFHAIGFHLSSEMLAEEEFRVLDQFLRQNQPSLVEYLRTTSIAVHGYACPAYTWIESHAEVEASHTSAAWRCVDSALRYYAGSSPRRLIDWLWVGFEEFANLQSEFMNHLSLPTSR
jgi:hypothetical protein